MSNGGGGSGNDGSNDTDVSGAEAVATGGTTYSDKKTSSYHSQKAAETHASEFADAQSHIDRHRHANEFEGVSSQESAGARGEVFSDDEYDTPDKAHWKDTQKQIKAHGNENIHKMSKDEYEQFNKELNEHYGTKDVKYEPYGRAGKGTVNLSFKEHWDNVGMQHPIAKFSPIGRFLVAAGRNVGEYLTSDYGTHKYGGSGTDQGGLLGRIGTGDGGSYQVTSHDREVMNKLAPDAPYIVAGTDKPDSIAQNWFDNTSSNQNEFFFKNQYSAAKAKQLSILGKPSPYGWLAVNQSPYYDFLKQNKLDRGIL